MNDLQVPKRRVAIEIYARGGEHRSVTVFLSENAPSRVGPERVSDLLAQPEAFFPALDHVTDRMSFVSRSNVVIARVARAVEEVAADAAVDPCVHEVEVTLLDGRALRGSLSYVSSDSSGRVVDFLNDAAPFFPLLVPGDDVLLVNKLHVARVALVSP